MELHLQPEELLLVRRVLGNYLTDLRMEIIGTESYTFRQGLKQDEAAIRAIIERLQEAKEPVS